MIMAIMLTSNVVASESIAILTHRTVGTYYTVGIVFGQHVDFLVDSGSAYTVLSSVNVPVDAFSHYKNISVIFADGKRLKAKLITVKTIQVGQCIINNVEVILLPGTTNILGVSALEKLSPVVFDFKSSDITFNCNSTVD